MRDKTYNRTKYKKRLLRKNIMVTFKNSNLNIWLQRCILLYFKIFYLYKKKLNFKLKLLDYNKIIS